MASKVPNGLGTVVKPPGYSVGIKLGYCSVTTIRTTSNTTSTPGAKRRSAPVAADTTPRNSRLKLQKGLDTPKFVRLIVASPRVGAVEAGAQQPQEERERLQSRRSACAGARRLPKTTIHEGSDGDGRRLVKHAGKREGFLEGLLPIGDQSAERRPPWLSSFGIMRISDTEDLTERVSCCAASERLIEVRKGRTVMRERSLRPRCLHASLSSAICLAVAAAAVESVTDVRAWARLDDTGIARSSDTARRPRSSAGEATSTSEGTTCLLLLMPVISGTIALLLPSVDWRSWLRKRLLVSRSCACCARR